MPLIKSSKKGKKGNGIGGKKLLKEIEKRNQLAFNKDKEKNGKYDSKIGYSNYYKNRLKSKSKNTEQQNILKYIVNKNFYGMNEDKKIDNFNLNSNINNFKIINEKEEEKSMVMKIRII